MAYSNTCRITPLMWDFVLGANGREVNQRSTASGLMSFNSVWPHCGMMWLSKLFRYPLAVVWRFGIRSLMYFLATASNVTVGLSLTSWLMVKRCPSAARRALALGGRSASVPSRSARLVFDPSRQRKYQVLILRSK